MKRLLGILLVVVLVVPVVGLGCGSETTANDNGGSIELQLPTPSPSPPEGEEGELILPGTTLQMVTPTPEPGEVILTMPWKGRPGLEAMIIPEPGEPIVVYLNCAAGSSELLIFSQYMELRGYVYDLNQAKEEVANAILRALSIALFGVPLAWDFFPEYGVVMGVLESDYFDIENLPFVYDVRGSEHEHALEIVVDALEATVSGKPSYKSPSP